MKDHMAHMRRQHDATLWVHFAVMLLGVWLMCSPAALGTTDPAGFGPRVADVTRERQLAPPELRAQWLMWSDITSGALMVLFGALSLFYRHRWAQWGTCAVGLWLLAAPMLFWVPSAAAYANETLVAALAIAFSILVPMMPGMSMKAMMDEGDIPPGWDYSPSSWSQRLPIIALGFAGFFIARYLTAYQLGHIREVWDPFFGDGTRAIITSSVSRAWPIPDAGLGALSYLLEALSGLMGGRARWRTMPWMVAMFGVLVVPLGGVSIVFIMIQPVMLGTWCSLCLLSAAAMVFMLPYTFDEIVAMVDFLRRARREGQPVWKVFWHGGTVKGARVDGSPPLAMDAGQWHALRAQAAALPQALLVAAALGAWLMFSRITLGHEGAMADSDHLVGATVFVVSIASFAEVARPLRVFNMPLGAWLMLSPWVLQGSTVAGTVVAMLAGAALLALSVPRGAVRHRFGAWDKALLW